MTEVKFCGLTRRVDAQLAARLGARYLGVIFAGGPRQITSAAAREVFTGCTPTARRVGVFGALEPNDIPEVLQIADELALDVLQLHGEPDTRLLASLRAATNRLLWPVVRIARTTLPDGAAGFFEASDAVVLDAKVAGQLGGTGVTLEWEGLANSLQRIRGRAQLVLAGGLTASNVARAIAVLAPDVVDVSSGVESAPGIKSPAKMRRFLRAVAGAEVPT